ncbi:MAG TPA: hypothetical protein PKC18_02770, partial [Lacipirellulaceae bacterium]|nr:hypothetical protein [Lacipirellulaceae bacterium]
LLPGSRTQEVEANAPDLLRAAGEIAADVPEARFAVAAFNATQAAAVEQLAGRASLPVDVHVGRTPELISAAACCLACSGSVSLELLYHARPSVVLYQVGRVGYFIQSLFRRSRYITLVNLLSAERIDTARPAWIYDPRDPQDAHVLLPEYLTCTDKSDALAEHVVQWLRDPAARAERVAALEALRERFGQGGASTRAAAYIAGELTGARAAAA